MLTFRNFADLLGRALLALIFIAAGFDKVIDYSGGVAYMQAFGIPGVLMPVVIASQIGLGASLLIGYRTTATALLLAGYTLLTAAIFHTNFAEYVQIALFFKNVAIAGGLSVVAAHGANAWSLDARRSDE